MIDVNTIVGDPVNSGWWGNPNCFKGCDSDLLWVEVNFLQKAVTMKAAIGSKAIHSAVGVAAVFYYANCLSNRRFG